MLTCFMFLLWPTLLLVFYDLPYYFPTVLRAVSASVYTVPLCMCDASMFAFKFLRINSLHRIEEEPVQPHSVFGTLFTALFTSADTVFFSLAWLMLPPYITYLWSYNRSWVTKSQNQSHLHLCDILS